MTDTPSHPHRHVSPPDAAAETRRETRPDTEARNEARIEARALADLDAETRARVAPDGDIPLLWSSPARKGLLGRLTSLWRTRGQ